MTGMWDTPSYKFLLLWVETDRFWAISSLSLNHPHLPGKFIVMNRPINTSFTPPYTASEYGNSMDVSGFG